jgi:hypothetical protein
LQFEGVFFFPADDHPFKEFQSNEPDGKQLRGEFLDQHTAKIPAIRIGLASFQDETFEFLK